MSAFGGKADNGKTRNGPPLRGVILFHAPGRSEGNFNNPQKRNRIKKFLVLYRMDMAEMQKMMASTSAEERKKSMGEWEGWMKKNMASFATSGGLFGKQKKARGGVQLIPRTILAVSQSYRQNHKRLLRPSLPTIRISPCQGLP